MGRIFETRKHTMFARWDRMAKMFTRLGKDIVMAVKAAGPDPAANPQLRRVIQNARAANMPKDKIEAAIKRAAGKDATSYEEIIYEGYAPHGIAVIVECATDNQTRTVSNVRHIFKQHDGSMGNSGSIAFMFERKGLFKIPVASIKDVDEFELEMIDHGLDELTGDDQFLYVYTSFHGFGAMQKALEEKGVEPASTELQYIPTTTKELNEEQQKEVNDLIEALEEDDDVQSVYHTMQ